MNEYDPDQELHGKSWLALSEIERLTIVRRFHEENGTKEPSSGYEVHAAMHCIVETQVASGNDFPTAAALQRLMKEGLGRHEAVHAIASVVAQGIFDTVNESGEFSLAAFTKKLSQLTAESWKKESLKDSPVRTNGE